MRGEQRAAVEQEIEKALLLDKVSQQTFFLFMDQHGVPRSDAIQIWNGASCGSLTDDTLEDLYALLCGASQPADDFLLTLSGQQKEQARMVLRRVGMSAQLLFGKSFLMLSADELLAALSNLGLLSAKSVSLYQSVLKNFATWCIEQGRVFPICDSVKDPRLRKPNAVPVRRAAKSNYVGGLEELERIVSAVFRDNSNNTGCMLVILLFLGFSAEDARLLLDEEVVESGADLVIRGERYPLTTLLVSFIRRYRMTKQSAGDVLVYYATPGPYFLRKFTRRPETKGDPLTLGAIRSHVSKVMALYLEATGEEKKLSETSLRYSGWFAQVLRLEKEGRLCNVKLMQEVTGLSEPAAFDALRKYKDYKSIYA